MARPTHCAGALLLLCACSSLPPETPIDEASRFIASSQRASLETLFKPLTRPHVSPRPFRVATLPHAALPEPLATRGVDPPREPVPAMVVDRAAVPERAELRDHPLMVKLTKTRNGIITGRFDDWGPPRAFGRYEETFVACHAMNALAPPMPARWISIVANGRPDGVFTVVDAWITGMHCDGWIAGLTRVPAAAIHPSAAMYAMIDTATPDAPDLVVLMPEGHVVATATPDGIARVAASGITEIHLPLNADTSASIVVELEMTALHDWYVAIGDKQRASAVKIDSEAKIWLGIEIVPGEGNEPLAVTWSTLAPAANESKGFDLLDAGFRFDDLVVP